MTGGARTAADVAYGVDVGGTKILGVAITRDAAVVADHRVATPEAVTSPSLDTDPAGALVEAVVSVVHGLMAAARDAGATGAGPAPVGVGLPGMVIGGALRFSPHLPKAATPGGAPPAAFARRLGEHLFGGTPVVDNDANLAAVAELTLGAARGLRNGLVVTLGTGIGGAVVLDGEVRTGAHGIGGEVGHMVVDPSGPACPCGGRGCWERYASGGGLARLAREAALAGSIPAAVTLAGGHPELVRGEHVTEAASRGDEGSLRVVEQLGWWLALGLANLAAALDPERIVVGGGLAGAGDMLLAPARRAYASLVFGSGVRPETPIVGAEVGERSGAVGAALAASGFLGATRPRAS